MDIHIIICQIFLNIHKDFGIVFPKHPLILSGFRIISDFTLTQNQGVFRKHNNKGLCEYSKILTKIIKCLSINGNQPLFYKIFFLIAKLRGFNKCNGPDKRFKLVSLAYFLDRNQLRPQNK